MFLHLHKCVRNDYHCPNCRTYDLTLYNHNPIDIDSVNRDSESPIEEGPYFTTKWVSEWERRGNGDRYTIQPIKLNKEYNLGKFEEEYDDDFEKNPELYGKPNWFLLKVVITDRNRCPDNIKIFTTFLDKKEDFDGDLLDDKAIELLIEYNGLWLPRDYDNYDSFYYKFVELKFDDGIMQTDIHSLCKYITPEFWFQTPIKLIIL
jgi:hypothetical protein